VAALHEFIVPGLILPFGGSVSPDGWLLCHGQAVSRSAYPGLFDVIGTTFGAGDGSTTFNTPDLRGRAVAGKDNMGGTAANRLNVALTGSTTSANQLITGLSTTAGLSIGMKVFGAGIPAGATVLTIASGTSITISANATATASGVALRFGVVDGATVGDAGGSQVHQLTTSQMPAHSHNVMYANNQGMPAGGNTVAVQGSSQPVAATSTGGDQAHTNVQPTMVLNYLIKT